MHQLAISLKNAGNQVTGSDDEIYDPSKSNLEIHGLLPSSFGWNRDNITSDLDFVILGMHAKPGNPEIEEAQAKGIKIYSYPEFIYEYSKDKTRVVIGGSHGKTTTTSMVMHILKKSNIEFDYLIGAKVPGFTSSVHLSSDNSIIVIEGDEYLSSALDKRSKFIHYQADIAILTGVAWDHINVFPTLDSYYQTFIDFIAGLNPNSQLFYFDSEPLTSLVKDHCRSNFESYTSFDYGSKGLSYEGATIPMQFFGQHNYSNMMAAFKVCSKLGIKTEQIIQSMTDFVTPDKRMNILHQSEQLVVIRDFAHAPSKVEASVKAVREEYPDKVISVLLELHTYSSLNKDFLKYYADSLNGLENAVIHYNPKTLEIKNMAPISEEVLRNNFNLKSLELITEKELLSKWLFEVCKTKNSVLLIMSSGHIGGISLEEFSQKISQLNP